MQQTQNLAEEADRILAPLPRDPSRPHYTTATFERKLRKARDRERRCSPEFRPLTEATLYLQRRDVLHTVESAGLTRRQSEVFYARAGGDSWAEIGRRHGHTKQGAFQIFKQALKKIRRAFECNPFRGLHQVYRQEVSRFAPSRLGGRR
ncbi:MAG: hypothetical protein IH851_13070 [Armatimonadetes bacterium]|nr:hypothetical protein [Armatimonadota bacterium]